MLRVLAVCVVVAGCAPMTAEDRAALGAGIDAMTMGLEGMKRPVAPPRQLQCQSATYSGQTYTNCTQY